MTEQDDARQADGPPAGYGQPGYGQPTFGYPQGPEVWGYAAPANGKGTTALVLGITSIVLFWVPFLYLVTAVPAGIVAIVLGNQGKALAQQGRASNRAQAQAGVVTGIVGLALCALNAVVGVLLAV